MIKISIAALSSLLLSGSALALQLAPDEPLLLQSIKYNGTGCPAGSAAIALSENNSIHLSFDQFVAEIGPGISLSRSRINCVVTLNMKVPEGWEFALESFRTSGFLDLHEGIRANYKTTYFFSGQKMVGSFEKIFEGPLKMDYILSDKIGLTSVVMPDAWSGCGSVRGLNLNTSLRLSRSNPEAFPNALGTATIDSLLQPETISLVWRKCSTRS